MQGYYEYVGLRRSTVSPLRANAASIAAFPSRPAAIAMEVQHFVQWRLRTYVKGDAENVAHLPGYILHQYKQILAHSTTLFWM
jgi:hypothetical protein